MSIKIGTSGLASKNVIDVKVGASSSAFKDIDLVKDWDGKIIWQRVKTKELTASNTTFSYQKSWSESSSVGHYEPTPHPYLSTPGDGKIQYYDGKTYTTLTEGTDYTIRCTDNRVPATGDISSGSATGTGKMYIEGIERAGYSGSFYKEFSISYTRTIVISLGECSCTKNDVILSDKSKEYDATDNEMSGGSITDVTYNPTGAQLEYNKDYTYSRNYPTNKKFIHEDIGWEYKFVMTPITGIGKYSGTDNAPYYLVQHYWGGYHLTIKAYVKDSKGNYERDDNFISISLPCYINDTQSRWAVDDNQYVYVYSKYSTIKSTLIVPKHYDAGTYYVSYVIDGYGKSDGTEIKWNVDKIDFDTGESDIGIYLHYKKIPK